MKPKYDFYFVFSLLFILVAGIFITYDHFQRQELDRYLRVVHDKIAEMITDENEKKAFNEYFEEFIAHVEDDSISPRQLEKLGDSIVSIRHEKDSLSKADLNALLKIHQSKAKEIQAYSGLANLFEKNEPDWKKIRQQLDRKIASVDSIKNIKKQNIAAKEILQKQLKAHEALSRQHLNQHLRIESVVDSIKNKIDLNKRSLSEKDRQILLRELMALQEENVQLNSKVDALQKIQQLLDNEREKMQQKLTLLDSIKNNSSKP